MMRPRPAPIAARIAISRRRPVARTSSRFATFAHAISSTNPTAPASTNSVVRTLRTSTSWTRSTPKAWFLPMEFGNLERNSSAVAEHGNGAAPRTILLLRKRAPPKDGRTEQPEELGADASAAKLLDAVAAGVIEHVVVERRGLLDDARLLAPMRELRGGRGGAGSLRRRVHEEHHAIRLGRRQRL